MMERACTADVCTRFALLIKAFVADRDEVSVISGVSASGAPVVLVRTALQDRKRLMGRGSEVARALRVLLDCIGEQHGVRYVLEVNGVPFEHGCAEALQPNTAAGVADGWGATAVVPVY